VHPWVAQDRCSITGAGRITTSTGASRHRSSRPAAASSCSSSPRPLERLLPRAAAPSEPRWPPQGAEDRPQRAQHRAAGAPRRRALWLLGRNVADAATWMLFATTGMRRREATLAFAPSISTWTQRGSTRGAPRARRPRGRRLRAKARAGGCRSRSTRPPSRHSRPPGHLDGRARPGRYRSVESGLLFTWPDGRPINLARFSAWFEQHVTAAGLRGSRCTARAHSYVAALKAGVPVKAISERLGHATAAITLDVYSHVMPGMDELTTTMVAISSSGMALATGRRPSHRQACQAALSVERK
jgi:integrase